MEKDKAVDDLRWVAWRASEGVGDASAPLDLVANDVLCSYINYVAVEDIITRVRENRYDGY